jgi:3-oxoacyl-[acyl-carrier protein] reductase
MAQDRPAALVTGSAGWTPMQRNVTVDDVAETIFGLITSHPFVTGETIVVDGGYAATT